MLNRRHRLGVSLVAIATTVSLTLGSLLMLAAPAPASAQEGVYSTASAVPANAAGYSVIDLDLESAQWQQVDALLERLGVPDALETFRTSAVEEADDMELTQAQFDAFFGGEVAFYILPEGIESMIQQSMEMSEAMAEMAAASPSAMDDMDDMDDMAEMDFEGLPAFEISGMGAILEPGDPATAWSVISEGIAEEAGDEDVTITETTEGDVSIITITPNDEQAPEFVIAHDGSLIIFAGNIIDAQTVIDTANGDADSLADLDTFNQVLAELPANAISFSYYDNSAIMGDMASTMYGDLYALTPELQAAAEAEYFAGISFWADDNGFRFDSVSIAADGTDLSALIPEGTVTFDSRVPGATSLFFSGQVLPGYWDVAAYSVAQALVVGMSGEEPEMTSFDEMFSAETLQEQLDQANQMLGFNLLDDFFGQFAGETAFALTFPNLMAMGSLSVDTVFVTELEDSAPVAESVDTLVRMVSSMAGDELPVTTRAVGDDTVYVLGDPATTGIPAFEVGVVGDQLVIGTDTGVAGFLDGPETALADDAQYQEVLGLLPGDNYFQVGYIDLTDIIPTVVALSGMSDSGASSIEDADPACLEFDTQADAQAAYDEDPFENSNLDQDFDGQACEDFFNPAPAVATPAPPAGGVEALEAAAAVAYEADGNMYSSGILVVGEVPADE